MIDAFLLADIQSSWRMRQNWIRAETKLILQGKAICRAWTEGDKDKADHLYDGIQNGKVQEPALELALMPFLTSVVVFSNKRKELDKHLKKLVHQLPIWPWVQDIKGFAEMGLAAVVGEAGDLSNYATIAKLWKRMGLAVMDGLRQGRVEEGLDKKERAVRFIEHGYSPHRRAAMFANIGDPLIKGNKDGIYRTIYLRQKAIYLGREDMTPMHAHRMAQRYMEKRLLKHLWQAWRRTTPALHENAMAEMSAVERRTIGLMHENATWPLSDAKIQKPAAQ